jgi:hypothetical protein
MRRLLIALLALGLVAACGGDDDDSAGGGGGSKSGVSKAELISQGDAICADINAFTTENAPATNEEVAAFLDEFLPKAQDTRDRFEAIVVAEGEDPDDVQTDMIFALDGAIERLGLAKAAADAGDFATMNDELRKANEASNAANQQAQAYGFKKCAQDQ